jgi:hypothetical protein
VHPGWGRLRAGPDTGATETLGRASHADRPGRLGGSLPRSAPIRGAGGSVIPSMPTHAGRTHQPPNPSIAIGPLAHQQALRTDDVGPAPVGGLRDPFGSCRPHTLAGRFQQGRGLRPVEFDRGARVVAGPQHTDVYQHPARREPQHHRQGPLSGAGGETSQRLQGARRIEPGGRPGRD